MEQGYSQYSRRHHRPNQGGQHSFDAMALSPRKQGTLWSRRHHPNSYDKDSNQHPGSRRQTTGSPALSTWYWKVRSTKKGEGGGENRCLNLSTILISIRSTGGVCYVAKLDMDRVSNRLSRSSSVIYESSHLPDGAYNISTSAWLLPGREFQKRRFYPFFNFTKKSAYVVIGASGDVIRARWGSSPREDKKFILGQLVFLQKSYRIHLKPWRIKSLRISKNIKSQVLGVLSINSINLRINQLLYFPTRRSPTLSVDAISIVG
jgi:hypothetical protein